MGRPYFPAVLALCGNASGHVLLLCVSADRKLQTAKTALVSLRRPPDHAATSPGSGWTGEFLLTVVIARLDSSCHWIGSRRCFAALAANAGAAFRPDRAR